VHNFYHATKINEKDIKVNLINIDEAKKELYSNGIVKVHLELPIEAQSYLKTRSWEDLDKLMAKYVAPQGYLFKFLKSFHNFNSIEHIIAIRQAEYDEEGIWHDDGSRHIAFTWSLNEKPEDIDGGNLYFRKKNNKEFAIISPPIVGTFIIFLTGEYHYEHRVGKVTKGERKTFAGWCSTL